MEQHPFPMPVSRRLGEVDGIVLREMTWTFPSGGYSADDVAFARRNVEDTFKFAIVQEERTSVVAFKLWAAPTTSPTLAARFRALIASGVSGVGEVVDFSQRVNAKLNPFDLLLNRLGLSVGQVLAIGVLLVLAFLVLVWGASRSVRLAAAGSGA